MVRRRARIPLNVFLSSRLVGRLHRQRSGAVEFQYDPGWLDWENALPISISLPLREDRYLGDPVMAVFDNLLPDPEPVRRLIADRIRAEGHDACSLLAKLGRDCVGALQILPEGQDPGPAGLVEGRVVDDAEIARRIRNLAGAPLGLDDDEEFRISIAGAQEKPAFLHWNERWHVPGGTTATTHIMKPQIGVLPNGIDLRRSVENEYLCLKLTAGLGLPSATAEIAEFDGERVLVVDRFDRLRTTDNRLLRLPQEDCCQALSVPPSRKYNADGGLAWPKFSTCSGAAMSPQPISVCSSRAQIVFWLLGATDGHAKNFSIFLMPGGRFRTTPLYDVISAQPAVDAGQLRRNAFKLALAVGSNRHFVISTILPRHFKQTVVREGVSALMIDEICKDLSARAEPAIEAVLDSLPPHFPAEIARSVIGGMRARLQLIEHAVGQPMK